MHTHEIEQMCVVAKGPNHGPAPIPQEGRWTKAKEVSDISGLTHGVGWCTAPLRLATYLGLSVSSVAFLGAVFTFLQKIFARQFAMIGLQPVPGFPPPSSPFCSSVASNSFVWNHGRVSRPDLRRGKGPPALDCPRQRRPSAETFPAATAPPQAPAARRSKMPHGPYQAFLPNPRPSGSRAGVRGFDLETIGLRPDPTHETERRAPSRLVTGTEFRLAEAVLGAPFRFKGTNRVFAPWRLCVEEFPLEDLDWVVDCLKPW